MKLTGLYSVFLGDQPIGYSDLEWSDPPVGVVGGILKEESEFGFKFLKAFCETHDIETSVCDESQLKMTTKNIPELRIVNQKGTQVMGISGHISGADWDVWEVWIQGIEPVFYQEEFPKHVQAFAKRKKRKDRPELDLLGE